MLFDLKSSRQDSDSELTVPRPPRPTANLACSHCLSSRVAPRILMRASLTRESKLWRRFGWSVVWVVHADKLTKTLILPEFLPGFSGLGRVSGACWALPVCDFFIVHKILCFFKPWLLLGKLLRSWHGWSPISCSAVGVSLINLVWWRYLRHSTNCAWTKALPCL